MYGSAHLNRRPAREPLGRHGRHQRVRRHPVESVVGVSPKVGVWCCLERQALTCAHFIRFIDPSVLLPHD